MTTIPSNFPDDADLSRMALKILRDLDGQSIAAVLAVLDQAGQLARAGTTFSFGAGELPRVEQELGRDSGR